MTIPTHLKHKPIIGIEKYQSHDGKTDAESLSIGIAQYDSEDISAKVFRSSNGKWSRQSEEIPLYRLIDLCSLMLKAILKSANNSYPQTELDKNLKIIDSTKIHEIYNHYKNRKIATHTCSLYSTGFAQESDETSITGNTNHQYNNTSTTRFTTGNSYLLPKLRELQIMLNYFLQEESKL